MLFCFSFVPFSLSVVKTFDLRIESGYGELKLRDQLDTPIKDSDMLKYAMDVFAKSGCFYFKIEFSQSKLKAITAQV